MCEWISVEKRLPEAEGKYLCVITDDAIGSFVGIRYFAYGKFEVANWFSENLQRKITHWMPLPEPPEVSSNV